LRYKHCLIRSEKPIVDKKKLEGAQKAPSS